MTARQQLLAGAALLVGALVWLALGDYTLDKPLTICLLLVAGIVLAVIGAVRLLDR